MQNFFTSYLTCECKRNALAYLYSHLDSISNFILSNPKYSRVFSTQVINQHYTVSGTAEKDSHRNILVSWNCSSITSDHLLNIFKATKACSFVICCFKFPCMRNWRFQVLNIILEEKETRAQVELCRKIQKQSSAIVEKESLKFMSHRFSDFKMLPLYSLQYLNNFQSKFHNRGLEKTGNLSNNYIHFG